ncbi:hypothetical protein [Pseudomonas sp. SMN11]
MLALKQEEDVCANFLHMTSYENRMSRTARQFLSADLGNRYHLSTPEAYNGLDTSVLIGGFSCRALPAIHNLELQATAAACEMFDASHAELRLVSGVHATLSTIAALTQAGDAVYSIAPEDGGHFATKQVAESLGRTSHYIAWDNERLNIDLGGCAKKFQDISPSMVFLDHGTPLFNLPVRELKALLPKNCILVYDASHTLGLIAGRAFQRPLLEGADVLQGNTHKTFPGPQKAMVLFKDREVGRKYSNTVSMGLVSSQHTHHTIALCITILEMQRYGKEYVQQMLTNARSLGTELVKSGIGLVTYQGVFTTSHELLISSGWEDSHLAAADRLFRSNISVNGRIAFSRPTLRVGVQELTRRGMGMVEMKQIASLLATVITNPSKTGQVADQVKSLAADFPDVHFSFDTPSYDAGQR